MAALVAGLPRGSTPCLRGEHPQEPGLGVPCRGHPGDAPALCHVGPEPPLHGGHPGREAGRPGRAEKGRIHRGPGGEGRAPQVEARGGGLSSSRQG